MVFTLRIGPGFIFEPCSYILFLTSHFPVTTLGLNLFSEAYINKLLFLKCPVTDNSSSQGVHKVWCFLAYKCKQESASKTWCFFKKLDNGQSAKKEDYDS